VPDHRAGGRGEMRPGRADPRGMARYGYLAGAIGELISHGVVTGATSERRRRRVSDRISEHDIVCRREAW